MVDETEKADGRLEGGLEERAALITAEEAQQVVHLALLHIFRQRGHVQGLHFLHDAMLCKAIAIGIAVAIAMAIGAAIDIAIANAIANIAR